jgi:hypothetical protein
MEKTMPELQEITVSNKGRTITILQTRDGDVEEGIVVDAAQVPILVRWLEEAAAETASEIQVVAVDNPK